MSENTVKEIKGELVYLPVEVLFPHPDNPRKELGDLEELSESIKAKGVLQNLTVIPFVSKENPDFDGSGKYTVIIGHRRLAASKMAGLTELPCVITEMAPQDQIATMLLENMQRNELTVYEQTKGIQMMLDLGESVAGISEKTGFSESTVRRRMKLAELDEKKFQKAEARGATLFDYMELDKIKSPELKNKVLDSIGTDNFRSRLASAIDQEKREERLAQFEEEVKAFATLIESTDGYEYKTCYSTWSSYSTITRPEDADEVEYFYTKDSHYISLYVKKDLDAEAEQRAKEKEKAEKKEKRLEMLKEATKRAYELRKAFVDSVTVSCIKKNFAEIVAYWMYVKIQDSAYVDEDEILEFLGIGEEALENETFSYELVLSSMKEQPELSLWKMVELEADDSDRWSYHDNWRGRYSENKELTAWYNLLVKMGYQMSDEEKELRDGTHELFKEEE